MNTFGSSLPTKSNRTLFTTLVGIIAILIGGLASVFSLFALLMTIGKPYARADTELSVIFLIFILPPGTLLAGLGLLLRHRWARMWMILLMASLITIGAKGLIPSSEKERSSKYDYHSVSDEARTSRYLWSCASIAIGTLTLIGLFSKPVQNEFLKKSKTTPPPMPQELPDAHISGNESQGWRVGHRGRDMMFYEELHDGKWQRIDIDGEMLMGQAHHVIYFRNADDWKKYPEWSHERRDEIIARIKSQFRESDYEYYHGGTTSVLPNIPAPTPTIHTPKKEKGSILMPLAFLLLIAGGAFWFAFEGIQSGEVKSIAKYQQSRKYSRTEEPGLYWTCISALGAVGTTCTAFAAYITFLSLRRTK